MKPNKLFLFLTITTVFCAGGAGEGNRNDRQR